MRENYFRVEISSAELGERLKDRQLDGAPGTKGVIARRDLERFYWAMRQTGVPLKHADVAALGSALMRGRRKFVWALHEMDEVKDELCSLPISLELQEKVQNLEPIHIVLLVDYLERFAKLQPLLHLPRHVLQHLPRPKPSH